ncbi:DUF397 domain-containing protein [Streptantibioticus silvisoli]|uniref:DUF397 domain-containing protein n=1 Tax=Streptantibioticus silvisoli TaxID=2705255 RepID=A0ABT6W5A4_9ACTN|nr:DUF397 domain-containing protein [Streptantibioticus silvisoli]MDI5964848.1 DUF397 domain-containing protein [Streptantibioticus silvisoli]
MTTETLVYRKSSYSDPGDCVEVADNLPAVHVRDSKNPDGPALTFTREAWGTFLAEIPQG